MKYLAPLTVLLLCRLNAVCQGGATVTANLGDTVQLPCTFPFIHGVDNLLLLWERMDGNGKLLVHRFMEGRDDLSQQDPQYTGRTALSSNLSLGNLALTLTAVTLRDGGTYYCRGVNQIRFQSISVTLSILDPVLIYNISSNSSWLGEDIAVTVQFSGEESHVTWELDGGRLPERYRLIDDNRTLIIPSVQRDDAERTFRVRVTNPVSEEVRDYRLEIRGRIPWNGRLRLAKWVAVCLFLLSILFMVLYLCRERWRGCIISHIKRKRPVLKFPSKSKPHRAIPTDGKDTCKARTFSVTSVTLVVVEVVPMPTRQLFGNAYEHHQTNTWREQSSLKRSGSDSALYRKSNNSQEQYLFHKMHNTVEQEQYLSLFCSKEHIETAYGGNSVSLHPSLFELYFPPDAAETLFYDLRKKLQQNSEVSQSGSSTFHYRSTFPK